MVKNNVPTENNSRRAQISSLIQFSAIFLAVNRDLNRDAVIGSRRRRIRQNFLLSVAIQFLRPDDRGEILVTDVQINIAADACDLALFRMLPDAVCTTVIRLVNPMRQPDGVAALDVIGGMRHERGCRAVETDEIARSLNSFKERPHNRKHFFFAEIKLLLLLQIKIDRKLKLLSLDDRQEYIRLLPCLILVHSVEVLVRTDRNASRQKWQ